jgi:hypothetical protein
VKDARFDWIPEVLQEIAWFLERNELRGKCRIIVEAAEKAGFSIQFPPSDSAIHEATHSENASQVIQFHRTERMTKH